MYGSYTHPLVYPFLSHAGVQPCNIQAKQPQGATVSSDIGTISSFEYKISSGPYDSTTDISPSVSSSSVLPNTPSEPNTPGNILPPSIQTGPITQGANVIPFGASVSTTACASTTKHSISKKKRIFGLLYINNKKWYPRLVPKDGRPFALLNDYSSIEIQGKLLICLERHDSRSYALFDSYIEFATYQAEFPPASRCFFEVIPRGPQKPHFDMEFYLTSESQSSSEVPVSRHISSNVSSEVHTMNTLAPNENAISSLHTTSSFPSEYKPHSTEERVISTVEEAEAVVSAAVSAIIDIFAEKGVLICPEREILIYTSHGEHKRSYHIVIHGYYHVDNMEAKALYMEVIKRIAHLIRDPKWIDQSVYKPNQQFRTLGSQKLGSGRVKVLQKTISIKGQEVRHVYIEEPESSQHEFMLQLEESLVSNIAGCIPLFRFNPSDEVPNHTREGQIHIITPADGKLAYNVYVSYYKFLYKENPPYMYGGLRNGLPFLKRTRPAKCIICKRSHESDNAFLTVDNGRVFFYCHREREEVRGNKGIQGRRVFVGSYGSESEADILARLSGQREAANVHSNTEELPHVQRGVFVYDNNQIYPDTNVQVDSHTLYTHTQTGSHTSYTSGDSVPNSPVYISPGSFGVCSPTSSSSNTNIPGRPINIQWETKVCEITEEIAHLPSPIQGKPKPTYNSTMMIESAKMH